MNKVCWGIIGCGNVTEVKSGPGFQNAEGSELVAVMRRNKNLAEDYAKRHGVPRWYNDAEKLINDPEVNAVYIATPPSSHKEYTFLAANAGKPVYVEKPMAGSYSECLDMIKACDEAKVPLFVAYYRRALPRFLKIKSILDYKTIGDILTINIQFNKKPADIDQREDNWRVNPAIAGCGYFCDLGSHMIDILQYFFGSIKSAKGYSSNLGKLYEAEDTVSASFIFENGIHGTGNWCFNAGEDLDRTEITGTKGKIIYSTFGTEPIILNTTGKTEEFKIENPRHIQQPLIQCIVDELLGKGKSASTGKTGAMTNKVIDEVLGRI